MSNANQVQAVTGFKVSNYQVKKTKDSEQVKIVLVADANELSAGEFDIGDVLKALWAHQASELDVGLSVFVQGD